MKRYSKLIIAAIIALIFIGTFVFLWKKSQPKPVVYNEFTPKVADISKMTIITGKIEPRNEVNVKPQISGIITELLKEAGDYVNAGDVIAKVKVIPDMNQLSSAESRVRLASINLQQAQVDFSREENLFNQKLVSADEFDKVKQALRQAREEKAAAEDALAVVRDGISKSNAKASSTLVRSTISGIIADEMAIGMINHKTTAVRLIPVPGKGVGEEISFGGLLGRAQIMPVPKGDCAAFMAFGGRIPAPINSLKN